MPVVTVPIVDLQSATPRSRLVALDLQGQPLPFDPGQAVIVGAHGQQERRPYSIACSPARAAETGRIELLIAADEPGSPGSNVASAARGTLVDVEGPVGTFTLPPRPVAEWLLFVAGGAGIAPLRAMLDHLLRGQPAHRLSLLYSARRADEFAFIDELRAHAAAGLLDLHQTVTRDESASWTGRRGRIGRAHFEALLHEPLATLCFVCGPDALVGESVATLGALGVPDAQIRTERWGR
ncbi:MAG: FAD-dependent oxidoreductase [Acidobacteria bacterium]|nr:FAD-dependent oxidoreductase [Acidobacteriota bacterium]